MVMLEAGLGRARKGRVERLFELLMRLIAVFALASGLLYWAKLTGLVADGAFRFDLLAVHASILYTVLALLMPTAALGLWLVSRWGVVLWVAATGAEIAAHGPFAQAFPARPGIAAAGMIGLTVLVVVAVATVVERRSARLTRRGRR